MHSAYIADGYNETAFIKETPRMYRAVRFTYRPMLVEERSAFFRENGKADPKDNNRRAATMLAKRIVEWDIQADGKPLSITADNILRLKPVLFERMLTIVIGVEAGDEDPQATDEESEEAERLKAEAEATGSSIGAAREARDAKN